MSKYAELAKIHLETAMAATAAGDHRRAAWHWMFAADCWVQAAVSEPEKAGEHYRRAEEAAREVGAQADRYADAIRQRGDGPQPTQPGARA